MTLRFDYYEQLRKEGRLISRQFVKEEAHKPKCLCWLAALDPVIENERSMSTLAEIPMWAQLVIVGLDDRIDFYGNLGELRLSVERDLPKYLRKIRDPEDWARAHDIWSQRKIKAVDLSGSILEYWTLYARTFFKSIEDGSKV